MVTGLVGVDLVFRHFQFLSSFILSQVPQEPDPYTAAPHRVPVELLPYEQQCESGMKDLKRSLALKGWERISSNDGYPEISKYYSQEKKRTIFMANDIVKASMERNIAVIVNEAEDLPKFNHNIQSARLLYAGSSFRVGYIVTRPMVGGLISSRDIVVLGCHRWENDTFFFLMTDTSWPQFEPNDDHVRGSMYLAGFALTKMSARMTHSRQIYDIDFRIPLLPQFLLDKLMPQFVKEHASYYKKHIETTEYEATK